MSDIVERLREAAASLSEIYPDYAEAADEISRLRSENERFRENEILLSKDGKKWRNAIDIITEMNAENEKLRAALKPFVNMIDDKFQIYEYNDICMSLVNYDLLMRICNNAKDALEGVTEKEGAEND